MIKSQMSKISQDSNLQVSSVKSEPFFFASEKKVTTQQPTPKAKHMTPFQELSKIDAKERLNMVQGFNPSKYLNTQLNQMAMRMKVKAEIENDK